jgi:hypothetical protein
MKNTIMVAPTEDIFQKGSRVSPLKKLISSQSISVENLNVFIYDQHILI